MSYVSCVGVLSLLSSVPSYFCLRSFKTSSWAFREPLRTCVSSLMEFVGHDQCCMCQDQERVELSGLWLTHKCTTIAVKTATCPAWTFGRRHRCFFVGSLDSVVARQMDCAQARKAAPAVPTGCRIAVWRRMPEGAHRQHGITSVRLHQCGTPSGHVHVQLRLPGQHAYAYEPGGSRHDGYA